MTNDLHPEIKDVLKNTEEQCCESMEPQNWPNKDRSVVSLYTECL